MRSQSDLTGCLKHMIIRADILVAAILHTEAARNRAKLYKSKSFIQMSGMNVTLRYRIKLQHPEAMLFSFRRQSDTNFSPI